MKTKWRIIFGAIIALLLIYIFSDIDFRAAYEIIRSIKPQFFLLAFASYSLAMVIFSLRSMISLRKIIFEHDFWVFMETTLSGFFINILTPGSNVGGEPVRAYFLAKKYKKPKAKVFGAVLADRVLHGAVILFFIIASLLFVLTYIPVSPELKIIFEAVLFFIMISLTIVFFLNRKKKKFNLSSFLQKIGILKKIKNNKKIHNMEQILGNFVTSFKKTLFDRKTMLFGILFSLAYWMLTFLSSYFLFLSLEIKISFFLVIIVVSLGSLLGDFSPTPGGIGLVEGLMVFLYSILGVNLEFAIIISVLSRLIGYFHSLVLGGISTVHLEGSLK